MTISHKKIEGLQVMRAIAATFVMMFHGMHMLHRDTGFWFLNRTMTIGYSGVDIFFVISGFIILYTSDFGPFSIVAFFKKRFIRVYPIYWIVNILLLIAYFISPSPGQLYKGNLNTVLGSLLLLPQQQYIIGIAWTLSYEIIFYIIFAIAFSISKQFLFFCLSLWTAVILIAYYFHIKSQITLVDTLLNPIIIEFFLGCLIAYLFKKYTHVKGWLWLLIAGIVLYIINWSIYYKATNINPAAFSSYMSRVYLFGLPAAILVFGLLYLKSGFPKVLVYLGDSSYSLYLIHGTVISVLLKLVEKLNLRYLIGNNIGAMVIFALTITVAMLFYRFIEMPIINQIKKRTKVSKPQIQVFSHN
jgi:peptidoglycan/LPS O-acetylase OafA/YrhL